MSEVNHFKKVYAQRVTISDKA